MQEPGVRVRFSRNLPSLHVGCLTADSFTMCHSHILSDMSVVCRPSLRPDTCNHFSCQHRTGVICSYVLRFGRRCIGKRCCGRFDPGTTIIASNYAYFFRFLTVIAARGSTLSFCRVSPQGECLYLERPSPMTSSQRQNFNMFVLG